MIFTPMCAVVCRKMSAAAASTASGDSKCKEKKRKVYTPPSRKSKRVAKRVKADAPKSDGPKSVYDAFCGLGVELGIESRRLYESKLVFPKYGFDTCPKCAKKEIKKHDGPKGIGFHTANRCEDGHFWWPLSRELEAKDPGWNSSFARWLKWIGSDAARGVLVDEMQKEKQRLDTKIERLQSVLSGCSGGSLHTLPLFHSDSDTDSEKDEDESEDSDG